MRDQADKLRQLVRDTVKEHPALEPGVPLIVVSSGAEGQGCSTVAVQLARELARLGKRIVLVDANLQQPGLTARLGCEPEVSLAEVLNGNRSAVEVIRSLGESIQFLPGRWTAEAPPEIGREAIKRLLAELRSLGSHAELVILDAGHGMSPWVQQLWRAAQQVLLVTTLESEPMKQSYAAVKQAPWGDVDSKVRLVINKSEDSSLAQQAGERFAATCRRFLGVSICQPVAAISKAPAGDHFQERANSQAKDTAFSQSVCLLAAEVLSSCLVLSSYRKRQLENSADNLFDFRNMTQSVARR